MNASSWQAVWLLAVEVAAVVGLTWLITWRLRSVVWQRTLWQAGLIAIIGLLAVEFSAVSFPKERPVVSPVTESAVEKTGENLTLQSTVPMLGVTSEPVADYQPAPTTAFAPTEILPEPVSTVTVIEESPVEEMPKQAFPFGLAIALGVWVVGSVVLAMRLLVGRFLLLRFCARSQTVFEVSLFDRVQGIARKLGMKQPVQVLETAHIQTPVVFGLFRLTIALPAGFTERFERRQQEAILAHELAHLAARDPLWYLLADALVSVLWWHPLVWVARARLQVASELAADEACVLAKHGPETLAECLVTIAKEMHGQGALESIGIEGSGFRSRLGQRVERLMTLSAELVQRPSAARTRLVKVGMPVVLVAVLLLGSGWMRQDGRAPWSDMLGGAWNLMAGVLRTEEADIRRDSRPVLMAAAASETTGKAEVVKVTETGDQRLNEATRKKLEEIKLKEMFFDGLPLGITLKYLTEESIKNDPQKEGIKMVWRGNVPYLSPPGDRPRLNAEGLPVIPPDAGEYNLNRPLEEVLVLVNPPKKNLNFKQVIEAVCEGVFWPLTYQIEDGAVVFTAKPLAKLDVSWGGTHPANTVNERDSEERSLRREEELKIINRAVETEERESRLDGIKFAKVSLKNVTLKEAVKRLLSNTPYKGLKVELEGKMVTTMGNIELGLVICNAEIEEGASLRQALDAVCKGAVYPLQYQYHLKGNKVVFEAKSLEKSVESAVEKVKREKVDVTALVQSGKALYEQKRLAEAEVKLREAMKLDPANNAAYYYMNLIQEARYGDLARKRDIEQRSRIVVPGQIPKSGPLPVPNPYVRTNVSQTTTKSRQRLEAKLDAIVFKEVFFDGLPLSEVVRFLQEESVKQDPEKKGINFIINSHLVDPLGNQSKQELKDPLGNPLAPVAAQQDLGVVLVTINPPLKNLTMREMLNAITNVTADVGKHGLSYKVEDYAVVFRERVIEPPQMFTRVFKVETNAFVKGLEKRMGTTVDAVMLSVDELDMISNHTAASSQDLRMYKIQKLTRALFLREGVNFELKTAGGAETQVFFNDRSGVLMVRATLEDLEIIQNAIERINTEVQAEAAAREKGELYTRVIRLEPVMAIYWLQDKQLIGTDISASALQAGLVRYLSRELTMPVNSSSGKWPAVVLDMEQKRLTARGTLKELQMIESAVQVLSLIPAQVVIEAKYIEVSDKAAKEMGLTWFTSGPLKGTNSVKLDQLSNPTIPTNQNVRVEAPVLPNYVSVLSLAQAEALVKRFESQDGSDVLSAPRVTTLSNRQARIEVGNKLNIVVKKQINAGAGPKGDDQTVFQTSSVSTGPALEVLPKVAADGLSLQLDWMVCITEFLGYDKPAKGMADNEPLPRFRVRQVANSSVLRDGQALLMGCGTSEVKKEKKGIFRSGSEVEKRHVIVMLTPRIIDPAGNLVNPGK